METKEIIHKTKTINYLFYMNESQTYLTLLKII